MRLRTVPIASWAWMLPLFFAGCGLMDPPKKALFELPKEKRVLVFVDVDPAVAAPAGFSSRLGEKISNELFKYKALEHAVAQVRLNELRRDQETFSKLGIADIARATDADLVIHVNLVAFNAATISDDSITQGNAQVLVKVIDSDGRRLWPPGGGAGMQIDARVDPAFADQRDKTAVEKELGDNLGRDVSRLFHAYSEHESSLIEQNQQNH